MDSFISQKSYYRKSMKKKAVRSDARLKPPNQKMKRGFSTPVRRGLAAG